METPVACAKPAPIARAGRGCDLVSCPKGRTHPLPLRNGRPDLVVVRERQGPVADDLARFMALAGHDQNIARAKLADGGADRLGAVADLARAGRACQDLGADRGGILGARIVVRDDHHVGLVVRRCVP